MQIGEHEAPTAEDFKSQFGLFGSVQDADVARILSACDVWAVPQGQIVLKAGEEPQCVVAVLQACLYTLSV
jgi:hypothetical protein